LRLPEQRSDLMAPMALSTVDPFSGRGSRWRERLGVTFDSNLAPGIGADALGHRVAASSAFSDRVPSQIIGALYFDSSLDVGAGLSAGDRPVYPLEMGSGYVSIPTPSKRTAWTSDRPRRRRWSSPANDPQLYELTRVDARSTSSSAGCDGRGRQLGRRARSRPGSGSWSLASRSWT
jgi:hypothetical protein